MLLVPWTGNLVPGTLIQRRHRFLLDVELNDGRIVVAHCVNPGRMEGLVRPGAEVWLSANDGVARRTQWVWELVKVDSVLICANSWTANKLVRSLLSMKSIGGLKRFKEINEEVAIGSSRIDFELVGSGGSHFIEVKSVQQMYPGGVSYFPDSKVLRSQEHIKTLLSLKRRKNRVTLLAVIQRKDAKVFRPSDVHDKNFSAELRKAHRMGLNVRAICVEPTPNGFRYHGELPVDLKPYNITDLQEWYKQMVPFSGWTRSKGDPNAGWRKKPKEK